MELNKMAKTNYKHVYLIDGWTNHRSDQSKIRAQYRIQKIGRGPYFLEPRIKELKPPFRIVTAEKKFIKSSAKFSSPLLYHLGLITISKKNKRKIFNDFLGTHNNYQFDNVRVLSGEFEGINLAIEKRFPKWLGIQLEEIVIPNPLYEDFVGLSRDEPLAAFPGHCRILSGEKALNALVRKGYESFVPLFKKAVEEYEGRKI